VFINREGSGFAPGVDYAIGPDGQSIALGDLNGDGLPELVTANFRSDDLSVLFNTGDGRFANAVSYPDDVRPLQAMLVDVDADGALVW